MTEKIFDLRTGETVTVSRESPLRKALVAMQSATAAVAKSAPAKPATAGEVAANSNHQRSQRQRLLELDAIEIRIVKVRHVLENQRLLQEVSPTTDREATIVNLAELLEQLEETYRAAGGNIAGIEKSDVDSVRTSGRDFFRANSFRGQNMSELQASATRRAVRAEELRNCGDADFIEDAFGLRSPSRPVAQTAIAKSEKVRPMGEVLNDF